MKDSITDLEVLRQLVLDVADGKLKLGLGKKSLNAVEQMLNQPSLVATSNIVKLAARLKISEASITRIAKKFGFAGFSQFQEVFISRSELHEDFYSEKAEKLNRLDKLNPKQIISSQKKSAIENINFCIDQFDPEQFNLAVRLLARARHVFMFGHKQSSSVAHMMCYGLQLIRKDVQLLGNEKQGLAIALGQIQANDLTVLISSAPYSSLTLDIFNSIKSMPCQVLSITDSPKSPFNKQSTAALSVPTEGLYYANSMAACLILVESLLSATSIELGSAAVSKLQKHELLVRNLDKY